MQNETKNTTKRAARINIGEIAPQTTTTTTGRLDQLFGEDNDNVDIVVEERRVARQITNGRVAYMPRKTGDRRVREWTHAEEQLIVKWYKEGKPRNTIAKLMDVSHAPLMRKLFALNVLSPAHIAAAYKCGYLK